MDSHRGAEFDVTGLGENSLDRVFSVETFPVAGGKVELEDLGSRPGGQVATTVLGCTRLGLRSAYLGVVGRDSEAEAVLAPLREAGVDLEGVLRRGGARTRTATLLVRAEDGERSVLVSRDPGLNASGDEFSTRTWMRSRLLHLDATDPDLALWVSEQAHEAGVPVTLDLDAVVPGVERILERARFPVVSRSFAQAWGGEDDVGAGLRRMARTEACRLAVATCEADGAMAIFEDQLVHVPAFFVAVRDSTGAGDAFRSGFIWALLQGQGVEEVLRTAQAVAALSCRAVGAQAGLPDQVELQAFLSSA